jgi:ABC-type multidrug transport system fused ATPase/permease subunit
VKGAIDKWFSLDTWRLYRQFWPHVRGDNRYFIVDHATIAAAVATNAVMIWLIGQPFTLLQQGAYDRIAGVLAIFASVVVFNQGVQYAGGVLTQWIGLRVIGRIRNAAVARLLFLSFPVAGRFPKGDLLARLSGDVDRLKACLVDAPVYLGSHALTVLLYVTMLFWIDVTLSLLALAIVPVYALNQRYFAVRKRRASEAFLEKNGQLLAFEDEALTHLRGISTSNAQTLVTRWHADAFEDARVFAMKDRVIDYGFATGFSLLIYLTGLVVVLVGIDGVRHGRFSAGELVSFLLYLGYLTVPTRGFAQIFFQWAGNRGAAERVLAILNQTPAVTERPRAPALAVSRGAIELRDLSFAYPDAKPLYAHLNLTIDGGETVALVGPSGVGKSTLAVLLLRFYDPTHGKILIDGQDVRDVSLHSLRQSVAMVWQEPLLIGATIRENLTMVRPEVDEATLRRSCVASHAAEFIDTLPQGLNTRLGAAGVTLSAGQKQRLAIAQAFLRDAPILILDEATSALDSHSEHVIVEALNNLRRGRTTLIIAHRYSSIKTAQRVIYFNADATVTTGRHEELLATHPGYRSAVEWQAPPTLKEHHR